ncbi:MAG: hypothetical protein JWR70_944 [Modestobacter sp.]|nr:hypothetical protein [Modestobacter sp.]
MTRPVGTTDGTVDGIDVDRVAAVVLACRAVAGLAGGAGGRGTYLPGRRVPGVVIQEPTGSGPATIEVHVIARYGPTMSEVAGQVRAALAALAPGSPVDVVVEDLATAPEPAGSVPG